MGVLLETAAGTYGTTSSLETVKGTTADVVKLVDTLGLDSNAAMFESSSLSIRIPALR